MKKKVERAKSTLWAWCMDLLINNCNEIQQILAAFQAPAAVNPQSLNGFSCLLSPAPCMHCVWSIMSDSFWPARLLYPWNFPDKNTGVGCHFLCQGIFPAQGLNPDLMFPSLARVFFTTMAPRKPLPKRWNYSKLIKEECFFQSSLYANSKIPAEDSSSTLQETWQQLGFIESTPVGGKRFGLITLCMMLELPIIFSFSKVDYQTVVLALIIHRIPTSRYQSILNQRGINFVFPAM